jgi:hypothetical protein
MSLCAFEHAASPAWVVNVTGPEILSIRSAAEQLSQHLLASDASKKRALHFVGQEASTALLSNPSRAIQLWGPSRTNAHQLIAGVAHWLQHGGRTLHKPTHFESRDGKF